MARLPRIGALLAVSAASLATGCAGPRGDAGTTGGAASCVALVRFAGTSYLGVSLPGHHDLVAQVPPSHMRPIGTGVMPACRDTDDSTAAAQPVAVARIDGFDSGRLVADDATGHIFGRDIGKRYAGTPVRMERRLAAEPWLNWYRP